MTADPELVAWVQGLPEGAEVRWYCDHMQPWCGWVDVQVEELESRGFNWAWTIVSADDDDTAPEDIVWPFDHVAPVAADEHGFERGGPAWSVDAINNAILWWCWEFANRVVMPVYLPGHGPSPIAAKAIATKEAIDAGTEESYVLLPGEAEGGEGRTVRVSESVMDFLIEGLTDEN